MHNIVFNNAMVLEYSIRSEEVSSAGAVPRGLFAVVASEGPHFGHLAYNFTEYVLDLECNIRLHNNALVRILYRGDAFAVSVK